MNASDIPIVLTISAKGYETFSQVITPLDDITVKVEMKKEMIESGQGRDKKSSYRRNKSKKEKDNLASNPFG
jgi:hypothetical protein